MAVSAKHRTDFVCESCGHRAPKWLGRCPSCQAWSSFVEEDEVAAAGAGAERAFATALPLGQVADVDHARLGTGMAEMDRVLGGGLVPGSLVLVGGDPGIGKSTLLLQTMGYLAQKAPVLYATAEESPGQIRQRAARLGISSEQLYLLADTRFEAMEKARGQLKPRAMVVDSVQTIGLAGQGGGVGSVAQIRAVTHRLMEVAKQHDVATFIVGHVTKEGTIAGPKVMEHMVDTVLYFEGERTGPYRILRCHKNRFGSVQEIGVFEMGQEGLRAVDNPSEIFLTQRASGSGSVVVTSLEGTRPLLLEVQALVTPAAYGTARRTTVGFDSQRVAILAAVLERRAGLVMSSFDIYVNVAGGVRISEPAVDLGVLLALVSAVRDEPIPKDLVVAGEVGLAGEVRGVGQLRARIAEAARLGFQRFVSPKCDVERWTGEAPALPLLGVENVREAIAGVGLGDSDQ